MTSETILLIGHNAEIKYNRQDAEHYFKVYTYVDLRKGARAELDKLQWKNDTPEAKTWYWLSHTSSGDAEIKHDRIGNQLQPVPVNDVITALETDLVNNDYNRVKWALSLLKEMAKAPEEISVLMYEY